MIGQVAYDLPFGSGRDFGLHCVSDQILGGWSVSSLFQWHGGTPFTPVIQSSVAEGIDPGFDPSFGAGSTLYPVLAGNPKVSNPSTGGWFNLSAYANPAYGTFANSGRNTQIGLSFFDTDFSVRKAFAHHFEGIQLEIRGDMYNVFNRVNYANPDANVGPNSTTGALADSYAGVITGPVGGQCVIQLGAHVTF